MIEAAGEYGRQWADYFGPLVLQNTVFLGFVFLALYLTRNASARIKYAIGTIGIFKLLVPPFIPSGLVGTSSGALSTVPQLASNLVFISSRGASPTESVGSGGLDVLGVLFVAWVAVAATYLLYALLTTWRLAARLRTATEVPAERAFGDLDMGNVRIYRSDNISLPMTVGVFPPRIYVPAAWEQWTESCRKMALKHELAHIKRHDSLFQLAELAARAVYFFHPLVWLLIRRLEEYREMACDDASTGYEYDSRLEYSRNLVEIAETVARDTLTCQSASALLRRRNQLLNRVTYQMKEGIMRNFSKKSTVAVLAGLALLIVPLSWYGTDAAAPEKKDTATAKSSSDVQVIDVSIENAKTIAVDGSPVTLGTLGDALDEKAGGDPAQYVVNLDCAEAVPMWVVFDVQRSLQKRDLVKISYASGLPAMPLVLPSAELEEKIKTISDENIALVRVDASGKLLFNGRKVLIGDLPDRVETALQENAKLIVSIHMEKESTYRDFVTVLDAVKKGKANRILVHNPQQ